ncbi:MAG: hypothetical protein AAGM22_20545 [Acidobacteriota bacterium]
MELLREFSRWSHVIVGFTGLAAFWFPVFARKGGPLHRRAGRVFMLSGYWVTGSAALSCTLMTYKIFSRDLVAENTNTLASLAFLAYLAWVTFAMLRYSLGVLNTKKDPTQLDTPGWRFLAYSTIAASAAIIAYAALIPSPWSIILYALSPIGFGTGFPMLYYMAGRIESKKAWFYEHLSATLAAGIAFHTAFAVFGASRLFGVPSDGLLRVLPWILPSVVGIPGLVLWKRHYQRKFGDLPNRKANRDPVASGP